jgi:hypothetical protein
MGCKGGWKRYSATVHLTGDVRAADRLTVPMLDCTALNTQTRSGNARPVQQFPSSCRHTDRVGSPAAKNLSKPALAFNAAQVIRVAKFQ